MHGMHGNAADKLIHPHWVVIWNAHEYVNNKEIAQIASQNYPSPRNRL